MEQGNENIDDSGERVVVDQRAFTDPPPVLVLL